MSSKAVADQIKEDVFKAMQSAEELGGPDMPEYIALMEAIARECLLRVANAKGHTRVHVEYKP